MSDNIDETDNSAKGREQCLRLLGGQSDEEKFAGLFLLVRFADGPDQAKNAQFLFEAWQALTHTFLIRLLNTQGSAEDVGTDISYRAIALKVIATFAEIPQVTNDPSFTSLLLRLTSTLKDLELSNSENVEAVLKTVGNFLHTSEKLDYALAQPQFSDDLCLFGKRLMKSVEHEHERVAKERKDLAELAKQQQEEAAAANEAGEKVKVDSSVDSTPLDDNGQPDVAKMFETLDKRIVSFDDDDDDDEDNDLNDKTNDNFDDDEDDEIEQVDDPMLDSSKFRPKPIVENDSSTGVDQEMDEVQAKLAALAAKPRLGIAPEPRQARHHSNVCRMLDLMLRVLLTAQQLGLDDVYRATARSTLQLFSYVFVVAQREEKLHAMEHLITVVPMCMSNDQTAIGRHIRQGCQDILSSYIDDDLRDPCLILCSLCCDILGSDFLFHKDDEDEDAKFLDLVVGLVGVEVRITIEYASGRLPKKVQLLSSCYLLLENVMGFLVDDETGWNKIDAELLGRLETTLRNTANIILLALKDDEAAQYINKGDVALTTARFLGAWLSEDTASLRDELMAALPAMLQLDDHFEATDNDNDNDNQSTSLTPLMFLLPAIQLLTTIDTERATFIQCQGIEVLSKLATKCAKNVASWYGSGNSAVNVDEHTFDHITPPGLFVTCSGVLANILIVELPNHDMKTRRTMLEPLSSLLETFNSCGQSISDRIALPLPEEILHVLAFFNTIPLILLREFKTCLSTVSISDKLIQSILVQSCVFVAAALPQRGELEDLWALLIQALCTTLELYKKFKNDCKKTDVQQKLADIVVKLKDDPFRSFHAQLLNQLN